MPGRLNGVPSAARALHSVEALVGILEIEAFKKLPMEARLGWTCRRCER
jgi:hypothetical protein